MEDDGEDAADEQLAGAGVGPVVEAVERRALVVQQDHDPGRGQGGQTDRDPHHLERPRRAEEEQQGDREQQVELLLDGE